MLRFYTIAVNCACASLCSQQPESDHYKKGGKKTITDHYCMFYLYTFLF